MKEIFPAVFESVWRRKETKIYLVFALYPLVYFVASFLAIQILCKLLVEVA